MVPPRLSTAVLVLGFTLLVTSSAASAGSGEEGSSGEAAGEGGNAETEASGDDASRQAGAEPSGDGEEAEPRSGSSQDDELDRLIDEASREESHEGWADEETEEPRSYPYLEHDGYFRFRSDWFWQGYLDTVVPGEPDSGTSAHPAPISRNAVNNDDPTFEEVENTNTKSVASANIRFRYSPTFHISRTMRVHTTLDVLDNMVLGSTPDFAGNLARPDVPLVAFATSQAPPSSGVNSFRDSIRVKEAYATWQPAFLLQVGRMASDWGLGILANGGQDEDDQRGSRMARGGPGIDEDYGDYADRALLLLRIYGVYVAGMYDFVYSGATSSDPSDFFGQDQDLGESDDVRQWVISFFQKPLSEEDKAKREQRLVEDLEPTFDWGVYTVFRKQDMDLSSSAFEAARDEGGEPAHDSLELVPRDAFAVIPDIWFRYQQHPNPYSSVRVELEATGIVGSIDNAVEDPTTETPGRDLRQFGAALETEYNRKHMWIGLDAGIASGDSAEGFGVEDRNTLNEPDGSPNERVTNFTFDRNYHVDLLLFREVIGSVTNAYYAKPWFGWDFFDSVEDALGARLDVLLAGALAPEATPGNAGFYGTEFDLRLFYEEKDRFHFDVETGFLVPGPAFDLLGPDGTVRREAKPALTIQGRLTMEF